MRRPIVNYAVRPAMASRKAHQAAVTRVRGFWSTGADHAIGRPAPAKSGPNHTGETVTVVPGRSAWMTLPLPM